MLHLQSPELAYCAGDRRGNRSRVQSTLGRRGIPYRGLEPRPNAEECVLGLLRLVPPGACPPGWSAENGTLGSNNPLWKREYLRRLDQLLAQRFARDFGRRTGAVPSAPSHQQIAFLGPIDRCCQHKSGSTRGELANDCSKKLLVDSSQRQNIIGVQQSASSRCSFRFCAGFNLPCLCS